MARIKHIRKDVFHLWAHQALAEYGESENWAKSPGSDNFSYRGKDAISYSMVVARIIDVPKQDSEPFRVYLLTSREYSSTHNGHMRDIRCSIPIPFGNWDNPSDQWLQRVFTVPNIGPDREHGHGLSDPTNPAHQKNTSYLYNQAAERQAKAKRARTNGPSLLSSAETYKQAAKNYCEVFGLGTALLLSDADMDSLRDKHTAAIDESNRSAREYKKAQAKQLAERKAREMAEYEARLARYRANIATWQSQPAGEKDDSLIAQFVDNWSCSEFIRTEPNIDDVGAAIAVLKANQAETQRLQALARKAEQESNLQLWLQGLPETPLGHDRDRSYLRIDPKDCNQVETTNRAVVPLEHVQRVAPLVVALIQRGRTYHKNGHTIRLGFYTLDSIDEAGTVRVGCHTFERAEIERFATLIGTVPAQEIEIPVTGSDEAEQE